MKSAKKIVVAVCMMVAMVAVLCSCGSKGADGTYVVESMMGMNVQQLLDLYAGMGGDDASVPKSAEDLASVKISGNNFTMKIKGEDDVTGTCEINGDKVKLTVDGETAEGTLKDGVLSFDMDGANMTFKKK